MATLLRIFVGALLGAFLVVGPAQADSPLTSTPFYQAYLDIPQVKAAHDTGRLTTRLGQFLSSSAPLEQRVAVVNALSWSVYGKQNAALFREVLAQRYKVPLAELDGRINPSEELCLAYLEGLDQYFEVSRACERAEHARVGLGKSYVAAIVVGLLRAQRDFKDFAQVWEDVAPLDGVCDLKVDMRPQARTIIFNYMRLYRGSSSRKRR